MNVLVTQSAPDFQAGAVLSDGSLVDHFSLASHIRNRYALLVFYPFDFSFVAPTELLALDHRLPAFQSKDTEVIAISTDSAYAHQAWRALAPEKGGVGPLRFPMVADVGGDIMRAYGVAHPDKIPLRSIFLLDKDRVIRHQVVNDLPLGHNLDESLRMVDALTHHQAHGEVCPAGWQQGQEAIEPTAQGTADYLSQHGAAL